MLHNQLMVWYPRPLTIKVELPPVRATETRQPKESILCQMAFSGLQDALSSGLSLCSLELRQLASVFSFSQREFNSLAFFFREAETLLCIQAPIGHINVWTGIKLWSTWPSHSHTQALKKLVASVGRYLPRLLTSPLPRAERRFPVRENLSFLPKNLSISSCIAGKT